MTSLVRPPADDDKTNILFYILYNNILLSADASSGRLPTGHDDDDDDDDGGDDDGSAPHSVAPADGAPPSPERRLGERDRGRRRRETAGSRARRLRDEAPEDEGICCQVARSAHAV